MSRVERMLEEMAENNLAMQEGHRVLEAQTVAFREEMRQAQRTWGELANKMGTLVEDIVAPGIQAVFQAVFGWALFDATIQRMRRRHRADPGRTREFDYVVVTRDVVLITQTKRTLRPDDIDELLAVSRTHANTFPSTRTGNLWARWPAFRWIPVWLWPANVVGS